MNRDKRLGALQMFATYAATHGIDAADVDAYRADLASDPDGMVERSDEIMDDIWWALLTDQILRTDAAQRDVTQALGWYSTATDTTMESLNLARRLLGDAMRFRKVAHARSNHNIEKGRETRRAVLDLEAQGKSIAQTAEKLGLHPTHVARIRGDAKRGKQ